MFHAVPAQLKVAIAVGIGLFIALIGFVDAGFVRRIPDAAQTTVPVQLGVGGQLDGWPVLVFVVGLLLIIALCVRKVKGAILICDRGHDGARDHRRGDRARRPVGATASTSTRRLEPERAGAARQDRRHPGLRHCSATSTLLGVVRAGRRRRPRCCSSSR